MVLLPTSDDMSATSNEHKDGSSDDVANTILASTTQSMSCITWILLTDIISRMCRCMPASTSTWSAAVRAASRMNRRTASTRCATQQQSICDVDEKIDQLLSRHAPCTSRQQFGSSRKPEHCPASRLHGTHTASHATRWRIGRARELADIDLQMHCLLA